MGLFIPRPFLPRIPRPFLPDLGHLTPIFYNDFELIPSIWLSKLPKVPNTDFSLMKGWRWSAYHASLVMVCASWVKAHMLCSFIPFNSFWRLDSIASLATKSCRSVFTTWSCCSLRNFSWISRNLCSSSFSLSNCWTIFLSCLVSSWICWFIYGSPWSRSFMRVFPMVVVLQLRLKFHLLWYCIDLYPVGESKSKRWKWISIENKTSLWELFWCFGLDSFPIRHSTK